VHRVLKRSVTLLNMLVALVYGVVEGASYAHSIPLVKLHQVGSFESSGNFNTLELRAPTFFPTKLSAQDIKKLQCKLRTKKTWLITLKRFPIDQKYKSNLQYIRVAKKVCVHTVHVSVF
jgi:hypothetical protein